MSPVRAPERCWWRSWRPGVCHTDAYTLSGADPEGLFPAILGHEGAGIVREIGAGVTTLRPGDHVIPLYTPECRQCKTCLSQRSNLCTAIRATQGKGVMPDGTSRFACEATGDKPLLHYMGCSTFANFTVAPEIALAKVREDAPFDKICYIGCGVTTGIGAVIWTAKVWPGANVVIFGLGGIGLNVIQGARMVGADKIIGVDINPARQAMAKKFGMTHFINPDEIGRDKVVQAIVDLTGGGADFSFECIGSVHTMRQALECCHRGWGHHRRRRRLGTGDRHPPVPTRHRPRLEGHGVWRRARAHRCAEDRRLVYGRQDQHRRSHHPHDAAWRDQSCVRPDARGKVDPLGHRLFAGMNMPLVFSYGSNMDVAAMAARCPRSKPLGPTRLARHRLAIMREGWLTAVRDNGATVHGVLWDIALADMRALDRYEGLGDGLYTKSLQAVLTPGGAKRAIIYLGANAGPGATRADYLAGVIAAARHWRLPEATLATLAAFGSGAASPQAAAPKVRPRFATPMDRHRE